MKIRIRRRPYYVFILVSLFGFVTLYQSMRQSAHLIVSLDEVFSGLLPQSHPAIISYIRQHLLRPPDGQPYNLSSPNSLYYSERAIEPLLDIIFNKKRNGVFVEVGAFDGETTSNTLYLEKSLLWSGLLIEPIPGTYQNLKNKHRQSWLSPTCLSTKPYPYKVKFSAAGGMSRSKELKPLEIVIYWCHDLHVMIPRDDVESEKMMRYNNCTKQTDTQPLQCVPIYSLLLAYGSTKIDFFSLDTEGSEMQILETIPFESVDIKVLLIETDKMRNKSHLIQFMEGKGYSYITSIGSHNLTQKIPNDRLFIKSH